MTIFDYQPPSKPNNFLEKIKHWWITHITKKHYYLGGGLLLFLSICLIFLYTNNSNTGSTSNTPNSVNADINSSTPAPSHPGIPSQTPSIKSDSICGLEAYSQSADTIDVPFINEERSTGLNYFQISQTHGPGTWDNGLPSCYAHTPQGAVLAAINLTVVESEPDLYLRTGELYQKNDFDAVSTYVKKYPDAPPTTTLSYEVVSYTPQTARISLGVTGTVGDLGISRKVYAMGIFDLIWEDGDWKLVAGENGATYVSAKETSADLISRKPQLQDAQQ